MGIHLANDIQCTKGVYLRITNKLHHLIHSYYMNDTPIQQADRAKYLGVFIDKNMNWNEHTRQDKQSKSFPSMQS